MKGEVEEFKWALDFGLCVWADLCGELKSGNELEWRGVLQLLRDSGIHLSVLKVWKEIETDKSECVEKFVQEIGMLSQSVQVDASRSVQRSNLYRHFFPYISLCNFF